MNDKQKGPAPDGARGEPDAHASNDHTLNGSDGRAARQLAFDLFRTHRSELIAEASRIMVEIARTRGQVTIEDVRAAMTIPEEHDPRWLGAVPNGLARRGILRRVGFVETKRPKAHARPISLWELAREPRPGEVLAARNNAETAWKPPADGAADVQLTGNKREARPARPDGRGQLGLFNGAGNPSRPPEDVDDGADRAGRAGR